MDCLTKRYEMQFTTKDTKDTEQSEIGTLHNG
jgi:hypothetical protein